ncbi:protein ALTERED SEED GERMINATION [Trifolium repens]|nr:protein ALTERED SEED GERMINATION [Trifolium repens]
MNEGMETTKHLDLRNGAKRSLADPPKQVLALKSVDISSTRPHLLLVGGSDAFARLYDRRMLPPLSSCVYFAAKGLIINEFSKRKAKLSDFGWPNLVLPMIALTYQHGLWEHAVMLPRVADELRLGNKFVFVLCARRPISGITIGYLLHGQ